MIVVPIVAAHGLTIPKTSSRAITSPAGTADTMEVLARVDVQRRRDEGGVAACRGCLVWGGHVNLSPADDILISVERPLSLDTREQMVASIMSKKLAAGSYTSPDRPAGRPDGESWTTPTQRCGCANCSNSLATISALRRSGHDRWPPADRQRHRPGSGGRGRHGRSDQRRAKPRPTLREKSLRLAAHLLEYDPQLRGGAGYARARELLDSGAALKKMQEIIDAQGPSACRNDIGKLTFDIRAAGDGAISEIDCLQLNRLARTAGAPIDKGAGIKLFRKIGDRVEKGQPLYRIHAYDQAELDLAVAAARRNSGYAIGARHRQPPRLSRERSHHSRPAVVLAGRSAPRRSAWPAVSRDRHPCISRR